MLTSLFYAFLIAAGLVAAFCLSMIGFAIYLMLSPLPSPLRKPWEVENFKGEPS